MKREELDAIRKRAAYVVENVEWQSNTVSELIEEDVPALLAEVERLKNRELDYRRMLIRIREEHLRFGSEIDLEVFRLLYTKGVR